MDVYKDEWFAERVKELINEEMSGWMGWMKEWMDGCVGGWING